MNKAVLKFGQIWGGEEHMTSKHGASNVLQREHIHS